MSWCPTWSNSSWQGWSWGLVHCSGGNATDPIWRVLASFDGVSSWTLLKPQHSNPDPNPLFQSTLVYWAPYSFHTLIIPHRLPAFLESLKSLKMWCSIHARCSKTVWSIPYVSVAFFPSLKQNCIAYRSSKLSDFLKVHQLWQSGFRVYSNCCYSNWFEPEIIKTGLSFHNIYSNNILNFQESTILNAHTKKVWKYIMYLAMIKFLFLAQFPVYHLCHGVAFCLREYFAVVSNFQLSYDSLFCLYHHLHFLFRCVLSIFTLT